MDVDTPTRPKGRFSDVTAGHMRPGTNRTSSGGNRPHPYASSSFPQVRPAPSPAELSTKWGHNGDLFKGTSNLYSPQVNLAALSERGLAPSHQSTSLRPFGAATPLPQSIAAPTPAQAPVQIQPDLKNRLGIRGSSNNAALANQNLAAEEGRRKMEEERRKRAERKEAERLRREEEEQRKRNSKDRAKLEKIAQQEKRGFVVQVDGLVYGTSSEDVQTAFGQYGETSFCFIVNEDEAKEGDPLSARLVFKVYDDAEGACTKLNGAIADGRPLKVQMVEPTRMPPPLPVPTGPKSLGVRNAGLARAAPAPPAAKTMYADEVESLDPRLAPPIPSVPTGPAALRKKTAPALAPVVDMMDVEEEVPRGPRAMRGGKAGRGGGRGGAVVGGSLASRLGAAPTKGGNAGGQKKGGSLLDRLK